MLFTNITFNQHVHYFYLYYFFSLKLMFDVLLSKYRLLIIQK